MIVNCSGQISSVFSFIDLARSSNMPQLFYTLYGLEHFFVQVLNLVAGYFIYLSMRIKIWHSNLTIITSFFVSTVYWCTTGRTIVMILNLTGMDDCDWLYRAAVYLQTMYACTTIHVLPAVVYERSMAYYYLTDYETSTRRYISPTAILFSLIIGFFLTESLGMQFSTGSVLIYAIALNGAFFVLFLWLWRQNSALLATVDEDYCLSKRFQLMENLKVFKLLRNTAYTLVLIVVVLASFKIFVPSLNFYGIQYHSYLTTSMIWAQTIIVLVAVQSVDVWRTFVKDCFLRNPIRQRQLVVVVPVSAEADLYFEQLYKSWTISAQVAPKKKT